MELHQPDLEAAGRFVYFLRRGGVPENWRVQQRTVRGGGIGTEPAFKKAGKGNGKANRYSPPASFDDLRAEDEALLCAGTSLVFVPRDF